MKPDDQITLRAMLRRAARWFGANEAVADETTRLRYGDLLDAARRFAALYHDLGVRRADRVAMLMVPSTIHAAAFFGAVEAGALPVALHPRESAEVLAATLDRVSPRVVVCDGAFARAGAEIRARHRFATAWIRAQSSATPPPDRDAAMFDASVPGDLAARGADREFMPVREGDPAAIVLSSGSTGLPKGIVHTNRSLLESARGALYYWGGIKPTDAIVNVMTTSFIGWHNLTLPFLNVGAKVVFRARWDPATYLDAVERERVTHLFLAPTMWRLLLGQGLAGRDLGTVRIAYFAGEMMDRTTLERVRREITPVVANVYGSTESGSCSAGAVLFREEMTEERLTSVGRPLLNGDLRVVRPGGGSEDEAAPGERGEVLVRGPSVAAEVWDDPSVTRRTFIGPDPWWRSGDEGYLDADGFLHLTGRLDDVIISGGINIHPARVEETLLSHPAVAECAVVGEPDTQWGQRVTAYVIPRSPGATAEALDAFLVASPLSNYQRPRRYVFVDELPRTTTGKINRRALREAARAAPPVVEP